MTDALRALLNNWRWRRASDRFVKTGDFASLEREWKRLIRQSR